LSEARSGLLAGIGPVGDLLLLEPVARDGFAARVLLDPELEAPPPLSRPPAAFVWPAWLAAGDAILVSTVEPAAAGDPTARLLRYDISSKEITILYENPAGIRPMGPGLPHYLNPSPDGRHVLVLTQTAPSGLVLVFVDAAGRGPGRPISRGAPLFSAWSPASDAVLLHVGGELSLMDLATAPSTELFATNHVGYRVPAWAPHGRAFAASAPDRRNHSLVLYDRDGRVLNSLAPAWSSTAFAWSPDGEVLAQAQSRRTQPQRYSDLQLVATASGAVRRVHLSECSAFIWSPTSELLAALVPDASGQRLGWTIVDRDGRIVRRFPPLQPSQEMMVYTAFFDQYLLSHALWSPNGAAIIGFGRLPYDGLLPEFLPSCIYEFDIASGEVRSIAAGSVAFWSPLPGR
jgi:hypothetical protein